MKLCNLVAYKFLTKYLNFGVSQCISGHVISQNMVFIRLGISQPFLKIETSDLDQKIPCNYVQNISLFLGSSSAFLVTWLRINNFFDRKVPISLQRSLLDI